MRWMRDDDRVYGEKDWPEHFGVIGVDDANRNERALLAVGPFVDDSERPVQYGPVFRFTNATREVKKVLDERPEVVPRPTPEDAQVWDIDWHAYKKGDHRRVPVIARSGGALGFVECGPDLDADGDLIPVGWVEDADLSGRSLDGWPVIMVNRPGTKMKRFQAPWPLLRTVS